jgi:ABC-type uncharacterized transport system permease subunit
MILSSASPVVSGGLPLFVALLAIAGYVVAALPPAKSGRIWIAALHVGWLAHLAALVLDIGGIGQEVPGARVGFGPVLSLTVWLVMAVHTVENRFMPLPAVRRWLAVCGAVVVVMAALFPGEPHQYHSPLAPLHFALGVGSYSLFGAAVVHAMMLDASERRLRERVGIHQPRAGMPLLLLERLTFRFVEAGFSVLTATILLGALTSVGWRWDHKVVFSLMGWAVFAALLVGRHRQGWRGRQATRWVYVGAVLLLLAYAGSRFVFEVLLGRPPA